MDMEIQRIFISKAEEDLTILPHFCHRQGIILDAQPMIGFESLPFVVAEDYDVLLINSIRAFDFFIQREKIPVSCKIACVGNTTAEKIEQRGYKADFVGKRAGNPSEQRKYLTKWLGKRRVLVPCSTISLRSMTKEIPAENLQEIKVYKTVLHPVNAGRADVYIFTSPSNVQAFFLVNTAPSGKVIAWGRSTEEKLVEYGTHPSIVLKEARESELMKRLTSLLNE
jgi:uroporphyrinogen-III synthase